ncbi:MAG: nitroreductase family protein [Candidatus Bathyarchaeota archaeon]|nr:nitroreductase family protein [Candidatus Bathyarchaeota archaeon]
MSVFETIRRRRSIRKYLNNPVEPEKIEKILEAARLSPSANNNQPWHFVVVTDMDVKEQLFSAYPREWFKEVPAVIVACADPNKAWSRQDGEELWKVDVAIAVHSMSLVAYELGLGTCWLAAFDEEKVKKALSIPKEIRALVMLTVGYGAEEKEPNGNRKRLEEIRHLEHW